MPPSIFISAKNVFLHQLSEAAPGITLESAVAGTVEGFTAGDMATAQADGFRRGQESVTERCEGSAADCGPVSQHDSEGVPLCQRCWDSLVADSHETKELGAGERITQKQMLAELAELGPGWRLEKPHELFAQVDYGYKNQHGAYTRDETLRDGYYWTDQETPWYEGGRVVVGFYYGNVGYYSDNYHLRAFARAVRVAGQ